VSKLRFGSVSLASILQIFVSYALSDKANSPIDRLTAELFQRNKHVDLYRARITIGWVLLS
jgi:hypothetical protein